MAELPTAEEQEDGDGDGDGDVDGSGKGKEGLFFLGPKAGPGGVHSTRKYSVHQKLRKYAGWLVDWSVN